MVILWAPRIQIDTYHLAVMLDTRPDPETDMPEELELVHEPEETRGGFYLRDSDGETLGEITYEERLDDVLCFDHTWVADSLRGQGQAGKLLETAMEWVRSVGKKVEPKCPYVRRRFETDESLADLQA
jgi:predicted GNAT family acetyltransferase